MSDVAAAAGVSLKTVSRVVNDEPGVRRETAEIVHRTIAQLGFRRNDLARALRHGRRSGLFGLVIEDVSNPFYSAIARGVEEVTRRRGMLAIAASSDEDDQRERDLVRLFCERRVDGLLVVPAGDDHRYMLPELRSGTRVVFIDRPPGKIDADGVLLDNMGGARIAVEHLLANGHRRIGFVGDASGIFTAAERLRGYRKTLAQAGLPPDPSLIRLAPTTLGPRNAPFTSFWLCRSRQRLSSWATTASRWACRACSAAAGSASRLSASTTSSSVRCSRCR
jgi:LacI family transcriptional regulator